MAGEAGELLHPDLPVLGAIHDHTEAQSFAKIAVVASPAVASLIEYCKAEARAILQQNVDIVRALVEALIARGTLLGDEIDEIIFRTKAAETIAIERQRRRDWQQRQESAARFSVSIAVPPEQLADRRFDPPALRHPHHRPTHQQGLARPAEGC
jgi:hypothetical protein